MKIKHIGYLALCNAWHYDDCIQRIDLGAARYKRLGVRERLKDEKPYRVCKNCIRKIEAADMWPTVRKEHAIRLKRAGVVGRGL
jgi:hypothetical protein